MNTHKLVDLLEKYKEILISNLIMIAEIPPTLTFPHQTRADLIEARLSEYKLLDISKDEAGNIIAIIPATHKSETPQRTIALVSHLDTIHNDTLDHTIQVTQNTIEGPGLVDNSLGVATLMTLPYIFNDLSMELTSDILLCFSASSLGYNDLKGTRFFLEHINTPIDYGICVEGYPFGRISYESLGILRQEIITSIPDEFDWSRFGQANPIIHINTLINSILEIPVPNRPKTSIIFNKIKSGHSTSITSSKTALSFEIRSESNTWVHKIAQEVETLLRMMSVKYGVPFDARIIAKRNRGGLPHNHPLVTTLSGILDNLGVSYRTTPSTSDLSAFIDKEIPAITLGITTCEHYNQEKEIMHLEPCTKGMAQLIALIQAIDKGLEND